MLCQEIYIHFLDYEIDERKSLTELIETKKFAERKVSAPFSELRKGFDPKAGLTQEKGEKAIQLVIHRVFPKFSITSTTKVLSEKAEGGSVFDFTYLLSDDRRSWSNEAISQLYAQRDESEDRIWEGVPRKIKIGNKTLWSKDYLTRIDTGDEVRIRVLIGYRLRLPK